MRTPKFAPVFAPEAIEHLNAIERKYHGLIARTIDEQLGYTPEHETRNRKRLEQPAPFDATWELRLGPDNRFRVFYEVNSDERTVRILAIGLKEGNRLIVGRKEFKP
jgi:mRNA-degrading endonuclease RelE of RelBE toxin-antitoxin system